MIDRSKGLLLKSGEDENGIGSDRNFGLLALAARRPSGGVSVEFEDLIPSRPSEVSRF